MTTADICKRNCLRRKIAKFNFNGPDGLQRWDLLEFHCIVYKTMILCILTGAKSLVVDEHLMMRCCCHCNFDGL